MKIIAFEDCPTLNFGGSERSYFDVLTELKKRGHGVELYFCREGNLIPAYEQEGIRPKKIDAPFLMRSGSKLSDFFSIIRLAWKMRTNDRQSIIYLNFTEALPLAALLKMFYRHAIVCHIRLGYYGLSKQIRLAGRMADICITINQQFKPVFETIFNRRGKVRVIYNGLPIPAVLPAPHTAPPAGPMRLLCMGRISPEKGIIELVNAFSKAIQKGFSGSLQITGDYIMSHSGDYRAELAAAMKERGVTDRITISKPVPEPIRYMSGFDLFVFPPIWQEPFGRTVPEAILAGIPVLARNIGMISEVMADNPHFVFNTDDELAEKIVQYASGQLSFDFESARKRIARDFNRDRMIDEVEQVLLEVEKMK